MRVITIVSSLTASAGFLGVYFQVAFAAPKARAFLAELPPIERISEHSSFLVNSVNLVHNFSRLGLLIAFLLLIVALIHPIWNRMKGFGVPYIASFLAILATTFLALYAMSIFESMLASTTGWRSESTARDRILAREGLLEEAVEVFDRAKADYSEQKKENKAEMGTPRKPSE